VIQCQLAVNRYALNTDGTIGSLYDGWIDDIVSESFLEENFIRKDESSKTTKCDVLDNNRLHDDDNFLRLFDIDNELQLSIILKMTPSSEKMITPHNYRLSTNCNVRFLFYYSIHRQHRLLNDFEIVQHIFSTTDVHPCATHIITDIKYGIDFIIKLEFSLDENQDEIDLILKKICNYFQTNNSDFLPLSEEEKLNQLTPTIFSRITELYSLQDISQNFSEMCQHIHHYLFKQEQNIPLWYTIHPLKIPSSDNSSMGKTFVPLDATIIIEIQEIILRLSNILKSIQDLFHRNSSSSLSEYLQSHYRKTFENFNYVKNMYEDVRNGLSKIVVELRQGTADLSKFRTVINNLQHEELHSKLTNIHEIMSNMKNKDSFIIELKADYGLDYYNVADLEDGNDHQPILEERILSAHSQQLTRILCSSNKLMNKDPNQHIQFCQQLMAEKKINPSLHLVFADYSYCEFILPEMKLLSSTSETSTIESKEINILLLGETGVGKSTFINAFTNYLAFESIERAEKDGPIVLIPVSFTMINDDQFDEYEIRLDERNNNSNEDFDHPGQTITQHCQSYLFNLNADTKLRIIDTPGIGDTRGISQDDKNIQSILSYVSHLSHLNAVCILLKPSISRIHILFRSCLEQIFNFLGPNARDNIVFCFTNSRSTFFQPGNTASLLKRMLNDLPFDHTPQLGKTNMFCFDSESFRYLAAIKSSMNIQFQDEQKVEFHMSWNKSVDESIRLMNLIKSRSHYQMNTWHSIKHAQILITSLIRPILEAIRNILRNQILHNSENKQYSIELQAESLSQPSYLCTTCSFKIRQSDILPMVNHSVHQYRTVDGLCEQCPCQYSKHLPILYELKYDLCSPGKNSLSSETNDMRDCLLQGSIVLAHFLLHMARIDEDLFLPWFDLFIHEEHIICSQDSSNSINRQLHRQLIELKTTYERQLHDMKSAQTQMNIDEIYQWIEKIQEFQIIKSQMHVINESEPQIIQYYEHNVLLQYPDINRRTPLMCSIIEH
jgi:hypothetical protein